MSNVEEVIKNLQETSLRKRRIYRIFEKFFWGAIVVAETSILVSIFFIINSTEGIVRVYFVGLCLIFAFFVGHSYENSKEMLKFFSLREAGLKTVKSLVEIFDNYYFEHGNYPTTSDAIYKEMNKFDMSDNEELNMVISACYDEKDAKDKYWICVSYGAQKKGYALASWELEPQACLFENNDRMKV